MPRRLFIYGLFDPRNGELRYVGKGSTTVPHRLASHLSPSSLKAVTRKNGWLKSILKLGLKPEAGELEAVPRVEDIDDAERYWISTMRYIGCRLTNMTKGGDGQVGMVFSAEHRAKIAAAQIGVPKPKWSMERRARPNPLRGRKRSPEAVAKLAAAKRGQKHTVETLALMSAVQKAKWSTDGYAAKMSRAHGGRPFVDHLERRYESIGQAAREIGLSTAEVYRVLKGQRTGARGFFFRYMEGT